MRLPSLARSRVFSVFGFALVAFAAACSSSIPPEDVDDPNGLGKKGSFGSSGTPGMAMGSSGDPTCAEVSLASSKTPVDVIITIDTSGSMDAEIVQVRTNINNFVKSLGSSGNDTRVIVIGGKSGQNSLVVPEPLAGPGGADKPPSFNHLSTGVGSNDAWDKIIQSFDSTWKTMTRADAFKVFITFTDDEANYSGGATKFDSDLLARPGFGTAAARKYSYNSVVGWKEGTPFTTNSKCSSAAAAGMQHRSLSTTTGGLIDSICKTDFSGIFQSISRNVADQLACDISLPSGAGSDPTKVVVSTGTDPLVPVTDKSKCGTVPNGFFFDNPTKPTRIELCDTACTAARTASSLKVAVGCTSQTPR